MTTHVVTGNVRFTYVVDDNDADEPLTNDGVVAAAATDLRMLMQRDSAFVVHDIELTIA